MRVYVAPQHYFQVRNKSDFIRTCVHWQIKLLGIYGSDLISKSFKAFPTLTTPEFVASRRAHLSHQFAALWSQHAVAVPDGVRLADLTTADKNKLKWFVEAHNSTTQSG